TLRIKSSGLRAPHWHFNANEHGYLVQGTAWVGVVDDGAVVTTYNVTAGQVIFFPKNTVHWIKNVGSEDCFFLLFFSTHEELQTLDVDDVFFSTPEDIASRSLKLNCSLFSPMKGFYRKVFFKNIVSYTVSYVFQPEGGINFIRTFHKQNEFLNQVIEKNVLMIIKMDEILKHQKALSLSTLRIYNNGLRQPHFHFNANEMGYVISGCAKVGIINAQSSTEFDIHIGDVIFFPTGTQHYIKSTCDEDLLLILAFSTG
ncbi:hypothetical protein K5549_018996, partial [Capra hircus]